MSNGAALNIGSAEAQKRNEGRFIIPAMPTANSSKPWYKPVPLPKVMVKILAERRRIGAEHPGLATQLDPRDFLARARDLRERMPRVLLTEKDIRVAKKKGRP